MISIRNARDDETAILREIGVRAWEQAVAPIGATAEMRANAEIAFENFTRSSWLTITVAELDGAVAGWASREGLDDTITDFWVHPAFQRQGVGTALLAEIEDEIVRQGFVVARLETHARNTDAVGFFEKNGYAINWLSVAYAPKLDQDVQSVGLSKQLAVEEPATYGPNF
ncbi:GNAT family N-acetyltransferase [Rhizobiales bacterium RZME27]|jgi:ribosomal-protein-alanine N-acetyltransferase|uniref:GNAT family N-acetyltransferase n=1 Tax=Endobacterium cereale TaxID=2663029 RepID=A0A6A8AAH8_9HYPH|nr:GNAT family N-acetyltransferase [Endobacterium cereale]MEB2846055.1 GNAT family N-acetyltransferase [Endobacterium cereale]MQY48265.1 GNAT family N-acetyltransferase [Endobacterium cereale]